MLMKLKAVFFNREKGLVYMYNYSNFRQSMVKRFWMMGTIFTSHLFVWIITDTINVVFLGVTSDKNDQDDVKFKMTRRIQRQWRVRFDERIVYSLYTRYLFIKSLHVWVSIRRKQRLFYCTCGPTQFVNLLSDFF